MEHVRIAVVEDDAQAAETLIGDLHRYAEEKSEDFEIVHFSSAVTFLDEYRNNFDLVFMDIELPDGDGMDVVRKIRLKDNEVIVIFVTNMAQYAVKGYEVRALDFIVKPVSYYNFCIKLTDALDCFRQKKDIAVWISNKDGKRRLNASRILYVEVVQHMLAFHTLDGIFNASGSLASVEELLKDAPFALCNRCYLVNLRFVTAIRQYTVEVGEEELQISRLKHSSFLRALNNFLAGGI